jgi:hypothetical protein
MKIIVHNGINRLSLAIALAIPIQYSYGTDHITLNAEILQIFDGVPHTLDGNSFDDMLHVRKAAMILLNGKPNKNGVIEGSYTFNDRLYTAEELNIYEKEHGTSTELQKILRQVVEDFITLAEPFMLQARGTKHFMTHLIEEWVQKRNRSNSQLLNWHRAEEGKEFELLRNQMTSFEQLTTFCKDLVVFMEDLMYNCPKAFKQLVEKRRKNTLAQKNG